jgi:hypothetical protein
MSKNIKLVDCQRVHSPKKKQGEQKESLRRIQTIKDISIDHIVILEHGGKQQFAEVIEIKESKKEVIAQCYEPFFSLSTYIRCFDKLGNNVNIASKNIIASLVHPPVFGRRNQLILSKEQFLNIQEFCT